jgi:enolase-phosphatase E1
MLPIAAVLLDIEGTTTPPRFVREVLYDYARKHLPAFLVARAGDAAVAAELAEIRRLVPGRGELAALLHWMDQDAKVAPLKTLQGLIWRSGYADGSIVGALYPDVAPSLRVWARAGLRLAAFSSGSAEAQRLLFAHSVAGDLAGLFVGFFDTRVGGKREAESFTRLTIALALPSAEILFLSDAEAELDAAAASGMRTCQLVRPADGTEPSDRHASAASFPAVSRLMGLPLAA